MKIKITTKDVSFIKKLVYELSGNILGDTKDVMIRNRIEKLAREYNYTDVSELIKSVLIGDLKQPFINTFTTNKTEFFREVFQFEDLIERAFPKIFTNSDSCKIFCCASASGQEPYSIAIAFLYYRELTKRLHLKLNIIASDIDSKMIEHSREGIYRHPYDKSLFPDWISPSKYFQKREMHDTNYFLIRAKESVKKLIDFRLLNLTSSRYPFEFESFDVIFCRNVLIYFSINDQNIILKRLLSYLKIGGTLYLGHSESPLDSINILQREGNNIFTKVRTQ